MPNLDEIGKKVFEDETPTATQGALTFQRDPTSSVQSAESDGLLLATQTGVDLSTLSAPWCFFPKDQSEVLIELKTRGDKTNPHAIHRALLQRQAWEFARRDKADRAGEAYDHEIPIWFVSAHFPKWIQLKGGFRKKAAGCYHFRTTFFDLYWIVSNELPTNEALIPFLMTRDGSHLEDFFTWAAQVRSPEWLLSVLKVFRMSKDFIKEVMRLYPTPDDPEERAQRAFIAESLIEQDPDLKEKLQKEGKAQGEKETLQRLLVLKLGHELAFPEELRFVGELRRVGTDGISQLILASDKNALEAWLTPKPTPDPPSSKKITKPKK